MGSLQVGLGRKGGGAELDPERHLPCQPETASGALHFGLTCQYLRRRGEIAGTALRWDRGHEPVPTVAYTEDEHAVWRRVSDELAPLHEVHAHPEYLAAKERLALPADHVPQLHEVSERLLPLTGWRYVCAPGLVPLRDFYADLGRQTGALIVAVWRDGQPLRGRAEEVLRAGDTVLVAGAAEVEAVEEQRTL